MATAQPASTKKAKKKTHPLRLALYRKIEIGRKQVPEMSDDAYFRDWLDDNFSKRSRKELSAKELSRVVDLLARLGAVYTSGGTNKKTLPHVRPDFFAIADNDPYVRQKRACCAIWRKLGYSMTSLETRIKREFGVASFAWVTDGAGIARLLTDLKKREKSFEARQEKNDASNHPEAR